MNKNYLKITAILIAIMTIYSIAIYIIAKKRNENKQYEYNVSLSCGKYIKEVSEEEKEEYRAARRDRAEKHRKHDAEFGSYNIEEMKGVLTVVFKSETDKRTFMASHGWPEEKTAVSFDDLKNMMSGDL